MHVWNVLHAARWNTGCKNIVKKCQLRTIPQLRRAMSSQLRHVSGDWLAIVKWVIRFFDARIKYLTSRQYRHYTHYVIVSFKYWLIFVGTLRKITKSNRFECICILSRSLSASLFLSLSFSWHRYFPVNKSYFGLRIKCRLHSLVPIYGTMLYNFNGL